MSRSPASIFAVSQIIFGLSVLLAVIILPSYFFSTNQGGISNYGTAPATVWLFAGGFAAAAAGCIYAAVQTSKISLKVYLVVMSFAYLLVLASTFGYKDSELGRTLHEFSALNLLITMAVGVLLSLRPMVTRRNKRLALGGFALGIGLGVLTFFQVVHLLFSAQLLCGISFGWLITRRLSQRAA